ncbi:serine palmitoyltransferase [Litorimonas sp. RW-G-Af-16]|uniref:serine palmitoyltransferase n=1 Tax=Litorimonas sp. RW-G-Af-16 TaxID=3241168 RepID=UPI00390C5584
MSLFDKYAPLQTRLDMMMKIGQDALGVKFDNILSATRGRIGNRDILLAGTNNYLGLTFDEDCMTAAKKAVDDHGTGTTGSRVANGTYSEHTDLERELADHLGMPSCVVFTTGYQTNLAAISGLAGDKDVIFMDADAHACIIDGTRLTNASTIRFRHNSPEDLDKRLKRQGEIEGGNALVVIEGMYSMFGDIAPIDEFLDVTHRHGGYLYIDEAHSYGVFGPTGCGIAEEQGVLDKVDFISGTFSKSLASVGGFCASRHPEFEVLRKVMRPYMFTASATPSNICAALAAVEKVKSGKHLRDNLKARAAQLHKGLSEMQYDLCAEASPVIAIRRPNEGVAAAEWNWLIENGVYVNLAVPPGTPQSSSLLRISLSAAHTEADIKQLLKAFGDLKDNQGAILQSMMGRLQAAE